MTDKRESLQQSSLTQLPSLASNPEADLIKPEVVSVLDEKILGEPLVAHRLVLDFTPTESDNDFLQTKCCAFWKYLKSRTDLHHMLVLLDEETVSKDKAMKDPTDMDSEVTKSPASNTAVSILEYNEEQGRIDRVFDTNLQQSHCSLGPREYTEEEPTRSVLTKKTSCCCSKYCQLCRTVPKSRRVPQSPEAQALCQKLQDWDSKHPMSMAPPGHPPVLSRCVMQRKVIT